MNKTELESAARASFDLNSRPLADVAPRVPFYRGLAIGVEGAPCQHLYIIVAGQVLLSRRDARGEDSARYLLGAGDLFGEGALLPGRRWVMTARPVTDGAAHVLPAAQLARLSQYYPQLSAHVATLLSTRLEVAHRRRDVLTHPSARARLLDLLGALSEFHGETRGEETWIPIRLTHANLAEMVGLARETVGRLFTELEAEGIVRREGRRGFWLRLDSAPGAIPGDPSLALPRG